MTARLVLATLIAAVALSLSRSPARSFQFIGAIWPDDALPVPYCVNPANMPVNSDGSPILSANGFAAMVQNAFQTWQSVPSTYMAFSFQGFCDASPRDSYDGINTIGFAALDGTAGGATSPLFTHTAILKDGKFKQMIAADVIVDTRFAEIYDADYYTQVMLPHIILHEAGHFLGLEHSNDGCSVMIASGLNPTPTSLCEDDIAAVSILYPRN